ncbi:hypothetical protein RA210_U10357 [Rubrivivax sp. A210]|nr:hypothetical protein RA210_U10357 [Rubrivivax sp. A210]
MGVVLSGASVAVALPLCGALALPRTTRKPRDEARCPARGWLLALAQQAADTARPPAVMAAAPATQSDQVYEAMEPIFLTDPTKFSGGRRPTPGSPRTPPRAGR